MQERESDDRYERLMADMESICELLTMYGERQWLEWMGAARREIEARDTHGLTRLLQAYGGMGSFNDVYLHPPGDQVVSGPEPRRDNDRFEELRSQMWSDATALLRALGRET